MGFPTIDTSRLLGKRSHLCDTHQFPLLLENGPHSQQHLLRLPVSSLQTSKRPTQGTHRHQEVPFTMNKWDHRFHPEDPAGGNSDMKTLCNPSLHRAALSVTAGIWEKVAGKQDPDHLLSMHNHFCVSTFGLAWLCRTSTCLCLSANWTGTCTLLFLTPKIDTVRGTRLPVLTHAGQSPRSPLLIPLLLGLGVHRCGSQSSWSHPVGYSLLTAL